MTGSEPFSTTRRKPRPGLIVVIVLLHVLAIYGLTRALAPGLVKPVEQSVLSTFSVTITAPEDPPEPEPDEGSAGAEGEQATPQPVTAPEPPVPVRRDEPLPQAASTGSDTRSGARDTGEGTGAAGEGLGTGSGRGGGGPGGGIAVKPSVRSGEINEARDFPIPEGGRRTRFGQSVTVVFTVTPEGRARDCSVARSSADADTAARVCPLVIEKIRFNPARRADGTAVAARYGYRVDFKAR